MKWTRKRRTKSKDRKHLIRELVLIPQVWPQGTKSVEISVDIAGRDLPVSTHAAIVEIDEIEAIVMMTETGTTHDLLVARTAAVAMDEKENLMKVIGVDTPAAGEAADTRITPPSHLHQGDRQVTREEATITTITDVTHIDITDDDHEARLEMKKRNPLPKQRPRSDQLPQ